MRRADGPQTLAQSLKASNRKDTMQRREVELKQRILKSQESLSNLIHQ